MRSCTACGQEKPPEQFYWTTRRDGTPARHSKCKPCRKSQFKMWRESPEGREWKHTQGLNKLGIDLPTYADMFRSQGGVCAICAKPERKKRNGRIVKLAVDHNHSTGAVRGLLCHKCNSGLGAFGDRQDLVAVALAYLRKDVS